MRWKEAKNEEARVALKAEILDEARRQTEAMVRANVVAWLATGLERLSGQVQTARALMGAIDSLVALKPEEYRTLREDLQRVLNPEAPVVEVPKESEAA